MLCTWCSATYDSANISALSSEPSASTATSRILRCSARFHATASKFLERGHRAEPSGKGHGAPNVVAGNYDAQHKHAKGKRMQQAPQALVRDRNAAAAVGGRQLQHAEEQRLHAVCTRGRGTRDVLAQVLPALLGRKVCVHEVQEHGQARARDKDKVAKNGGERGNDEHVDGVDARVVDGARLQVESTPVATKMRIRREGRTALGR